MRLNLRRVRKDPPYMTGLVSSRPCSSAAAARQASRPSRLPRSVRSIMCGRIAGAACARMPEQDEPPPTSHPGPLAHMTPDTSPAPPDASAAHLIFQVASGFMASAALQVAMRLDIAERLSNGPRPVADLARDTGVQPDGLYRVLRALASLGIFDETAPRTFALTPPAELLRKGPGRLGDGIEFITDPLHFQTYAEAMHSVQTGKPAGEKVVG